MHELGIFTGGGGFALAGRLLGWRSLGYVDFDEECCRNVERRVDDGTFSPAPVFNCDVRDFVRLGFAHHYQGVVDVLTAGFPCQPFSVAGKRLGEKDPRNMWPATVECIRVVQPEWVWLENVADLRHPERKEGEVLAPSYLGRVFFDLAASGYDFVWDCIPARALGARHKRDRIWIVARANSRADIRHPASIGLDAWAMEARQAIDEQAAALRSGWWAAEPAVGRVADGVAGRAYRLRALGQGVVPAVARCAWLRLSDLLLRVRTNA